MSRVANLTSVAISDWWPGHGAGLDVGNDIITPKRLAANTSAPYVYVRSEHYEQARRINSVLRVYGEVLLRAISTAVFQGAGKYKYYMIGGQAVWIAVWP